MSTPEDVELLSIAISEEQFSADVEAAVRAARDGARSGRPRGNSRGWICLEGKTWRLYYRVRNIEGRWKVRSVRIGMVDDYPTLAAARAAGNRTIAQLLPKQLPPGASPSWPNLVQRYLDVHLPRTRPSSQETERSSITRHLLPAFERCQLHEITAPAIQKFIDEQTAMRRSNGDRLYRPKTIRDRASLLHRMLRAAKREGLAAAPTPLAELQFPRDDRPYRAVADRAFTEPELQLILAGAVDPWLTIYRVCLLSGLRIGEALALTWENIRWDEQCIDIRASASRRKLTATKTTSSAIRQAMPPELTEHLRAYRASWTENAGGFLFAGRDGQPLHSSGIGRDHLAPLLASLGIRSRSTHALRHSFGMRLGRLPGVSLARIAKAMRCSLRTAELYVSATDSDARMVIEAAATGNLIEPHSTRCAPPLS